MKMNQKGFRAVALIGAAALALAFAGETRAQNQNSDSNWNPPSNGNTWPYAPTGKSPVLAVVGDVACQPDEVEPPGEAAHEVCDDPKPPYTSTSLWESQEATANQIETMKPDLVALVGDLQYQVGEYSDFEQSFNLTYGAFKLLHRPAPGNHEFYDEHGADWRCRLRLLLLLQRLPDRCQRKPDHGYDLGPVPTSECCDMQLSGPYHPHPATRAASGWTGGALRFGDERTGGMGSEMAGIPIIWAPGTLSRSISSATRSRAAVYRTRHLVCRRTLMAEEGSRGESFRVHTRLLAPAHVQRCQQHYHRGHYRAGLLAAALRVPSRPGAERTRPPLRPLPPA